MLILLPLVHPHKRNSFEKHELSLIRGLHSTHSNLSAFLCRIRFVCFCFGTFLLACYNLTIEEAIIILTGKKLFVGGENGVFGEIGNGYLCTMGIKQIINSYSISAQKENFLKRIGEWKVSVLTIINSAFQLWLKVISSINHICVGHQKKSQKCKGNYVIVFWLRKRVCSQMKGIARQICNQNIRATAASGCWRKWEAREDITRHIVTSAHLQRQTVVRRKNIYYFTFYRTHYDQSQLICRGKSAVCV